MPRPHPPRRPTTGLAVLLLVVFCLLGARTEAAPSRPPQPRVWRDLRWTSGLIAIGVVGVSALDVGLRIRSDRQGLPRPSVVAGLVGLGVLPLGLAAWEQHSPGGMAHGWAIASAAGLGTGLLHLAGSLRQRGGWSPVVALPALSFAAAAGLAAGLVRLAQRAPPEDPVRRAARRSVQRRLGLPFAIAGVGWALVGELLLQLGRPWTPLDLALGGGPLLVALPLVLEGLEHRAAVEGRGPAGRAAGHALLVAALVAAAGSAPHLLGAALGDRPLGSLTLALPWSIGAGIFAIAGGITIGLAELGLAPPLPEAGRTRVYVRPDGLQVRF